MEQSKERLLGKTPAELKEIAQALGLPAFTGNQMAKWLYQKRVSSIADMTDIGKAGRALLEEKYEVGLQKPLSRLVSKDGTVKYLFPVSCSSSDAVEAVMIPDGDRRTLCVSSQAGCRMGCKFCMTGRQGFHGNLSPADILSQFFAIEEAGELTNAVFMGMGEPFDNLPSVLRVLEILTAPWGLAWSPKRVTVSSIGHIPSLKVFLEESKCHLAISLHNPFPKERLELMPVEKAWPLTEVVRLLKKHGFSGQRRVSFEYTVFDGWNNTTRHAEGLVRLLSGLECRVNLIRFHRIPDFPYGSALDSKMEEFRAMLEKGGLTATIRASRGEDIFAACGLLAGKHKEETL